MTNVRHWKMDIIHHIRSNDGNDVAVVTEDELNLSSQNDNSVPRITAAAKIARISNKKRPLSSNYSEKSSKSKRRRFSKLFVTEEGKKYAAEVKQEFESEKKNILDSLDVNYKDLFGKIAFCKWESDPYRPVLICSPYSVPPKLRETWMKMFKNTKGDTERMWYYTYWYGSPMEEAYTQSKRKDFILYEEGKEREMHRLDKKIQKKIEEKKILSMSENQTVQGFKELEIDLTKKPSQRRPENFVEEHEAILNLYDTVSVPKQDSRIQIIESDSTESEDYYDEEGGQKNKKSMMRGRKNKKGTYKPAEKNEKNDRNKDTSLVKEKTPHPDDEQLKKRMEAPWLEKRRSDERDAYKKCYGLFQTLIEEFQDAIEGKDCKRIMQCIKDIKSRDISKLTAPFMEETKLPILVKKVKHMLVDDSDKKLRKDLYDELRNVYNTKKDNVPEGWKELSRSTIKAVSAKVEKYLTEKNTEPENESRMKDEDIAQHNIETITQLREELDTHRKQQTMLQQIVEKNAKLEMQSRMKDKEIIKYKEKIRQLLCEVDSEKDFNLKAADTILHLETENNRIPELLKEKDEQSEKIKQLRNEINLLEEDRKIEILSITSRTTDNLINHESQERQIMDLKEQLEAAKGQVSELFDNNEKYKQLLSDLKSLLRMQCPT